MSAQQLPGGVGRAFLSRTATALGLVLALALAGDSQEPGGKRPVQVTIRDEKPQTVAADVASTGPVDPVQHVQVGMQGNMMITVRVDNQTMHLGAIQTMLQIDGQVMFPGNPPGRLVLQNQPLKKGKDGKGRSGFLTVYEVNKLVISQEVEPVATRAAKPGQRRRIDSALVRYTIENKDNVPHKVGVRIFMDVYIVNNDGALFAAPTEPGKVLDGVELKGKKVPDYIQFLQNPDLKNPGFVAHMTLNFGRAFETPDKAVLTRLGAFVNQWDLAAMQAMGDSAMGVYWGPRELKAGAKRQIAYGYGQGIVPSPEGDGHVAVALDGSFEPGKLFNIAAFVNDPAPGQTLRLELPTGMQLVEGKERQPVPAMDEDGNTMVLWKARVERTGQFAVRVHSSTGATQTKLVTITRPGE